MKLTCPASTRWIAALCCLFINVYGIYAQQPVSYTTFTQPVAAPSFLVASVSHVNNEIRGMVSDSSGALPGVSVSVKSKPNIGTTTDMNGKYILTVPDDKTVLVFSMVGFDNQEIPVKGREVIDVLMKRASNSLNDVVVVAFGKQKKRDIIGSVTTISPSDLKVPSSNLTTALAGRLAGVIAYQTTGEPGQDN
ncbi:MAG TPA: carboxypeptidase-like regulatory domain-containing protein, partial [Niastella sp.]